MAAGVKPIMRIVAVATAALALLAGAAAHAAPDQVNQERLDRTIRYLQNTQNLDGGYAGEPGYPSDPLFSCWVAMALAAAGINPQDQALPGGKDVMTYIASKMDALEGTTTDFDRTLITVNVAGMDPRSFGGVDIVKKILDRQTESGGYPRVPGGSYLGINETIWAVIALHGVGGAEIEAANRKAGEWLLDQQKPNGAWAAMKTAGPANADMTAAALYSLHIAGVDDEAAEQAGWDFVRSTQNADGGFAETVAENQGNSGSTAWIVRSMWGVGINPETWVVAGNTPLGFLASLQAEDGHIRWKTNSDLNPIWMTAYTAPAFAGHSFVIPAPPRAVKPEPDKDPPAEEIPVPTTPDPTDTGRGGTVPGGQGNTIVGGGKGAPLFSRPQPQSRGRAIDAPRRTKDQSTRDPSLSLREGRPSGGSPSQVRLAGEITSGGGQEVTGRLIGDSVSPASALRAAKAAPGPRSADTGGTLPVFFIVIAGGILLALGTGTAIEGRRRDKHPFKEAFA